MSTEESSRPSLENSPKSDQDADPGGDPGGDHGADHDADQGIDAVASPFPRVFPPRPGRPGVQLDQVLKACDAMVLKGVRPTIERVRQELGGGSPNTVSPMLEEWFRRLPARLAGTSSLNVPVPGKDVGAGQAGGVAFPFEVSQAAKHLWDTAVKNAEQAHARETQAVRRQLELQGEALATRETELQRRDAAFQEARKSLDAALASAQAAREALERQLADQAAEAAAQRKAADQEIARLGRQLSEAHVAKDALRAEHAAALAARDQLAQDAEERHIANERRLLNEVDRAREESKQAVLAGARERTARAQAEQQLAEVREELGEALRGTRAAAAQAVLSKAEADLRLVQESSALAQTRTELEAAAGSLRDGQAQLAREMRAHEATRELLKQAIARAGPPDAARTPRSRGGKVQGG